MYRTEKNTRNKQYETAYILYMVIGSSFARCRCAAFGIEKTMYLYYREMPVQKQIKAEEQIIRQFDRTFAKFQPYFNELQCTLHIRKENDNYLLYFATGFEEALATVYPDGQYDITCFPAKR